MNNINNVKFVEMTNSKFLRPYRILYKQGSREKIWDCIRAHDSVAILIFNKTRKVFVFVEQFRPPVFATRQSACGDEKKIQVGEEWQQVDGSLGITLELCAGITDKNLSPEQTAVEEIFEECGYKVDIHKLEKIKTFIGSVGASGGIQNLFYVEVEDTMKCGDGGGLAHEGEMLRVREMSLPEVDTYIQQDVVNSPPGFLFAILWFKLNKASSFQ
eukprot:TRINITY_DN24563_c0_g1_i1.p1 TRINITY_DN24563_c0_g1~~TRINITY_DN24563_c0_g1_i1.p1  ORF type:complete len:215 (+),score=44.56 TRINITY_DN24563_c0_g1_i1:28-672(+)